MNNPDHVGRKLSITRRLTFEAGHRVPEHESKCRHLHGHSYKLFATAVAPELDNAGRIIDFGVIKERLGGWVDEHWDHSLILLVGDPIILKLHESKVYWLDGSPTAEIMARHLLVDICPKLFADTEVDITKVVLYETENCFAEASW